MDLNDYKKIGKDFSFVELPNITDKNQGYLKDFVDFKEADLELKVYLGKLIICRCFSLSGGIHFPDDVNWFINNFMEEFKRDLIKPWLTNTIKEAILMILSNDPFAKEIIGSTFMFTVIEYYAKHKLGFRPLEYDFFDKKKNDYFKKDFRFNFPELKKVPKDISLPRAIELLQRKSFLISDTFNDIDKINKQRQKELGFQETRWTKYKISSRLAISRNTMLHGENHAFYDVGKYLTMLYILFYLCDTKDKTNN